jgi:hypothetical protein
MPFPLSFVRRFSDFNGQFVLLVLCPGSRHERAIKASVMAKQFGPDALVAPIARRLRCSKCGQRNVDVVIGGIPR